MFGQVFAFCRKEVCKVVEVSGEENSRLYLLRPSVFVFFGFLSLYAANGRTVISDFAVCCFSKGTRSLFVVVMDFCRYSF